MPARLAARLVLSLTAGLFCAACATSSRGTPTPAPDTAAASVADDRAALLVRLGTDTLAGEQFTYAAAAMSGSSVVRSPRTVVRSYTARLRGDGLVDRFELTIRPAAFGVPPRQETIEFGSDSVTLTTQVGDSAPRTRRLAAGGPALPYVPSAFALFEVATRYARAATRPAATSQPGDTVRVALVAATIGRVLPATITRVGADSMLISIAGDPPYRARVDAAGRILGLEGTPTQQVTVTRVPTLDLQALSADRPIGTLSPTDTARGRIGGAQVSVVYSRPSKRGRTILGGVVPYDRVWRTGANAATVLTTSADLTVGGARVPRGSYTLWTLPSASGWKLIINRQTGQWGTEYDESQDLARVDLAATPAAQPVEQFTVAVEASGGRAGRLRMFWDDFELAVPVVAR